MLGYIPSPSVNGFNIGPLRLHAYGFLIVLGVFAAVWLSDRRWRARGGEAGTFSNIAVWAVPAGLVGARLYSVLTDYELYDHNPLNILKIWQGGLGIWGGIAGGVLGGWLYIRRNNMDFLAIVDAAAPALPLAQAIGRWGNYFNQELFGRPTTLPWGVKIDASHIPVAYQSAKAFQPTFLYESLWDLAVVFLVLAIEKRVRLKKGYLFWVYVSLYTFGRFFTEYLRIDFAHKILGLRINDWVSILVFVSATALVLTRGLVREKDQEELVEVDDAERSPVAVAVAARAASGLTLEEESIVGQSMTSEVTGYGLHVETVDEPSSAAAAMPPPPEARSRPAAAEPVTTGAVTPPEPPAAEPTARPAEAANEAPSEPVALAERPKAERKAPAEAGNEAHAETANDAQVDMAERKAPAEAVVDEAQHEIANEAHAKTSNAAQDETGDEAHAETATEPAEAENEPHDEAPTEPAAATGEPEEAAGTHSGAADTPEGGDTVEGDGAAQTPTSAGS